MTDPNPDLDPDEVEQANVAAAAIAVGPVRIWRINQKRYSGKR